MKVFKIKNYKDFKKFETSTSIAYTKHLETIENLKPKSDHPFVVSGYSYTAKKEVDFACNFLYGPGFPGVNWREQLVCPHTQLNNRSRASIHIADMFLNIRDDSKIYIMEQTTSMYNYFQSSYKNVIGSEYLGELIQPGYKNEHGIRNEDVTNLSFENRSIDIILSFDVFEHVPNFKSAFSECHRILTEGGSILFSVPFLPESKKNIIRATLNKNGTVKHNLPPEYHGDPIRKEGVLCYQHFGWEMLEDLLAAGFTDTFALVYWSIEFGYYTQQMQFVGTKGTSNMRRILDWFFPNVIGY